MLEEKWPTPAKFLKHVSANLNLSSLSGNVASFSSSSSNDLGSNDSEVSIGTIEEQGVVGSPR